MNQRNYNTFSGFIFLLITIVHLLRVFKGWDAQIGETLIPMWTSWAVIVLAGALAYRGLKR